MDLTINYPQTKNNSQTFGRVRFEENTASEIARQAVKFYPKGQNGNSFYEEFMLAMDSFVLRQDNNKEVDIVVKHSKDWLGRKRIIAEVIPSVDTFEIKSFKQDVKPKKERLLLFLSQAEEFACKQQEKVKSIINMKRVSIK